MLQHLGLTSVLAKVVSQEPDVKGIVGKVALGQADAGFVYATDVRAGRRPVTAIATPGVGAAEGALRDRRRRGEPEQGRRARVVVARLLERPRPRELLARAGFGLP